MSAGSVLELVPGPDPVPDPRPLASLPGPGPAPLDEAGKPTSVTQTR